MASDVNGPTDDHVEPGAHPPSDETAGQTRQEDPADDPPAFGPSGYLPAKASARARKIVLRAPLGLQWVVGAVVAGLVVVVAGVLFLTRSGPPGEPFVATVAIDEVDGAAPLAELDTLLVTGGGPAVAFAGLADHDLAFCAETRRVEGQAEGVAASWHPATGRGDGVPSLSTHPVVVHDGVAHVDPTTTRPGPRAAADPRRLGCR